MHQNVRFHIFVFLLITILSLGGLGFLFIVKEDIISKSDQGMDQTRAVISQTQEALSLVYSMLAVQRGYLLSGDQALLDEYNSSKARITEQIAQLKALTDSNPAQESRVVELQHHYLAFTGILDDMVMQYKIDKNQGSQQQLNEAGELRKSFDRVAHVILSEEYQSLNNYIARLEQAKKSLYRYLSVGFVLASLMLTFLNSYLLQAHGRRRDAEESLKVAEERLRLAIKGTNDGIYDWDLVHERFYWSPQLKELMGYEDEELVASRETLDPLIHPADRDQTWLAIYKYLHRELPELSCVFRLRHKTGRWIWANMRGKALFNEDGKAIRLTGTFSDISSLKEYESRLEEAKTQAEKANAAKTEFLAHMSHEIRTPLTSISGVAEILMNQKKDFSAKQQQLISVLSSSTASLKELINDILDFSKIESGQLDLEEKPFALSGLFQEIIATLAVRAQEKGLNFTFNYDDLAQTVLIGDKARLRQILMNLIGNALKFTNAGAVDVRALRKMRDGLPVMQIEVQDSGIGIDEKNFSLVFERFRQADPSVSRKYGGTGLGLPISQSLADRMGGIITLSSVAGKGSLFTVILPLRVAETDEESMAASSGTRKGVINRSRIGPHAARRILLVEDYEGNVAVLGYMLENFGCVFDVARTGLEALNLWKAAHHDLILMDVQMPEMDGLTATRQIRKMEEEQGLPRTPVIGMTAHAFVEDKDKCASAGMDSYLAKPIAENDLFAEMSRYLESKEARPDRRALIAND